MKNDNKHSDSGGSSASGAAYRPRSYQRRATQWVASRPRCCLFLEMGLGKTAATLTAIASLKISGELAGPVLVLAPKMVAEVTWQDEVRKWPHLHGLTVATVAGDPKRRRKALAAAADLYVAGVDSTVWLLEEQKKNRLPVFGMVVLDELTRYKNHRSQRFKALLKLTKDTPRVIGLTGTPRPNGLKDLWGQLAVIDRGERLGTSYNRFLDEHFHVYAPNYIPIRITPKKGAEEKIYGKIGDICLSMQTEDYLELPERIDIEQRVELPPEALRAYRDLEREMVLRLPPEGDGDSSAIIADNAAALSAKLSQAANGAIYGENHLYREIHRAKTETLSELKKSASSAILCFYLYVSDAERIERDLGEEYIIRRYEGPETLREWNAGKIDILLAHPASCAYGLNMQAGGHVIVWYGATWDLEQFQQANARLHRQGQNLPVTVYTLVAAGTIDERKVKTLAGKQDGQKAMMDYLRDLRRIYGEPSNPDEP